MQTVKSATLYVFDVGTTSTATADADTTVPAADIESATVEAQSQDTIGIGEFVIDNDDGAYVSGSSGSYSLDIDIGKRVAFYTQLEGEMSESHRWTGLVTKVLPSRRGGRTGTLEVQAEHFPFGVLGDRHVTDAFDTTSIAGSSGTILNSIVSTKAPELTLSFDTISDTRTVEFQQTNLLEAVRRVISQSPAVVLGDQKTLKIKEKGTGGAAWKFAPSDQEGQIRVTRRDDDLYNDIRVSGIRDTAQDIAQTTTDGTVTASSSTRQVQQVSIRKGQVSAVELYVKTSNSDNLVCRVHPDDPSNTGNPKEPGNRESDLTRSILPSGQITADAWNRFEMPEGTSANEATVHILVESDGSTGQDVGTDSGTGELAYKIDYPYPTTVSAADQASIDTYRRKEGRYRRTTVRGADEGRNIAKAILRKHDTPTTTLRFGASSSRAHSLETGDIITVDSDVLGFSGEMVVTAVTDRYSGSVLETDVTVTDRETI